MLDSVDGSTGDINSSNHNEATEVLLSLLSQNKALGGNLEIYINTNKKTVIRQICKNRIYHLLIVESMFFCFSCHSKMHWMWSFNFGPVYFKSVGQKNKMPICWELLPFFSKAHLEKGNCATFECDTI